MYFFEHNLSIIGCLVSIIVVLTSTGFRPSAGRNVFLTSFSLFRRAMNRTSWALQACVEVYACDRTPLRERLDRQTSNLLFQILPLIFGIDLGFQDFQKRGCVTTEVHLLPEHSSSTDRPCVTGVPHSIQQRPCVCNMFQMQFLLGYFWAVMYKADDVCNWIINAEIHCYA